MGAPKLGMMLERVGITSGKSTVDLNVRVIPGRYNIVVNAGWLFILKDCDQETDLHNF